MSDSAELLRRWQAGDTEAGRELADENFDVVYRFFVTKVDEHLDDLVQQTFMACVAAARRFDPGRGSFRAFLLGIARNELLAHRRKRARESRAMLREAGGLRGVQSSPSGPVLHRQELALLLAALRRLPLDLQIVLELHYWEALAIADIAAAVEVPPGTIKSRLFRARALLRDELEAADAPQAVVRSTVDGLDRWAAALREHLEKRSPND